MKTPYMEFFSFSSLEHRKKILYIMERATNVESYPSQKFYNGFWKILEILNLGSCKILQESWKCFCLWTSRGTWKILIAKSYKSLSQYLIKSWKNLEDFIKTWKKLGGFYKIKVKKLWDRVFSPKILQILIS